MADEKKPSLAGLIADSKTAASGEAGEVGEDEGNESFDASASELFEAIKADDMEGFKTALRAAIASS